MKLLGANESKVAITTDMWTCNKQRKGYMVVTTHFIADDWILQNRLISIPNDKGKRPMADLDDVEGIWAKHVSTQATKKRHKCEVEAYLEEDRIVVDDNKFNLVAWWNAETSKYPTLSRIARDILAVPISTVALESAFSAGGRVVSPHRSRLHQDTVEALMCLQSWRYPQFKGITSGGNCQFASVFEDEDVDISEVLP